CSTITRQDPITGYSNLLSHVHQKHPEFDAIVVASGTGSETLVAFMDTKSQTLYCWIGWTVSCNLPFSFAENTIVRKYRARYLHQYVHQFGIIFDGWTFHSEHYVAVFAALEHDGHAETVLAMAPLVDDEVEDHTAEVHVTFLCSILSIFMRTTADLLFVTGDNCSTKGRVATLLGLPLVGCASHRLNWAVKIVLGMLKDFESASLKLQSAEGVPLLDVRDLFDALMDEHPCPSDYPFESRARGTEVKESVTAMRFAERPLKRRKEEHQDRIESRCVIYPTNL
ncbi:hypothetical protein JG687_00012715, partial [Phytophthora cactorum]